MRQIGATESGTLIIEMTVDEWRHTSGSLIVVSVETTISEPEVWAKRFMDALWHVKMNVRAYNRLLRVIRAVADYKKKGYQNQNLANHANPDALVGLKIFGGDSELLDFDQWRTVVCDRREYIMRLRNIGTTTCDEIVASVMNFDEAI